MTKLTRGRWSEAHERMRIAAEMERILRDQAAPNRRSPICDLWEYLDGRAALSLEQGEKP